MHWLVFLLCTPVMLGSVATASQIYRCEGSQGEPTFSQTPCGGAAASTGVAAPARPSSASGVRAGERAWLQARKDAREDRPQRRKAAASGTAGRQQPVHRRDYQCLRKRRALDALNTQLRAGYKAGRGTRLHQRRQSYEDYLAAFCP